MGKYRFERDRSQRTADRNSNIINFDSSPKYSICTQYGYSKESFRLDEKSRTDREVVYDVFSANPLLDERSMVRLDTDGSKMFGEPVFRGTLFETTDEQLRRVFGGSR